LHDLPVTGDWVAVGSDCSKVGEKEETEVEGLSGEGCNGNRGEVVEASWRSSPTRGTPRGECDFCERSSGGVEGDGCVSAGDCVSKTGSSWR
jgi:hypothetical protein